LEVLGVILGLSRLFFGSRVFLAFSGVKAIFNQFVIIIILIISKNVYLSII